VAHADQHKDVRVKDAVDFVMAMLVKPPHYAVGARMLTMLEGKMMTIDIDEGIREYVLRKRIAALPALGFRTTNMGSWCAVKVAEKWREVLAKTVAQNVSFTRALAKLSNLDHLTP